MPKQALRSRAEDMAREKDKRAPISLEAAPEELRSTLHELQVHQFQLEMQNEELRRTQAELEASRARYFALYDLAPVGYLTIGAGELILEANLAIAKLLGVARADLVKRPLTRFVLPEDQDIYRTHKKILETEARHEWELRLLRKDAVPFWVLVEATAVQDAEGVSVCHAMVSDTTERRRAAETLRKTVRELESALAEKTVLLQEIHHRVKNNLAVMSSLLGMKADATGSSDARTALEESQQRVHSIALIHELLYGNEHLDRIDFAEYARQLVEGLYAASSAPDRIAIELALDPIEIDIERAVPCALILNELVSNAFKYAFPDGRKGKILVRFHESGPGFLELAVEDDGIGLPAGRLAAKDTRSLGFRIVAILTKQLDGSIDQDLCKGTCIVLRFPAVQPRQAPSGRTSER
jgi:PAS domain S-box-containing protein